MNRKIDIELDEMHEQLFGVSGEAYEELPDLLRRCGYRHKVDMDEVVRKMSSRQVENLRMELHNELGDNSDGTPRKSKLCADWTPETLYKWRF